MANLPTFTTAVRLDQVQLANSANTNRDGTTGTYSTTLSAGASGSLLRWVYWQAITTTAAGLVRLFYSPDSGTTWREIVEIVTAAVTVSGTVGGDSHIWIPQGPEPLKVASTARLKFNFSNNTETWNMFAQWEDF